MDLFSVRLAFELGAKSPPTSGVVRRYKMVSSNKTNARTVRFLLFIKDAQTTVVQIFRARNTHAFKLSVIKPYDSNSCYFSGTSREET